MEETVKPEPIYTHQTADGNCSAQLYGEFNADNETVTQAELIIQRQEPRYIFTYLVDGTISEIDAYSIQLITELNN